MDRRWESPSCQCRRQVNVRFTFCALKFEVLFTSELCPHLSKQPTTYVHVPMGV